MGYRKSECVLECIRQGRGCGLESEYKEKMILSAGIGSTKACFNVVRGCHTGGN